MSLVLVLLFALGSLVAVFTGWVFWMRLAQGRRQEALRESIRRYAEKRGARVDFDTTGFTVKGPLGSGHERLTALEIMCRPGEESRWETSIGFVLRKYIPDAFDDAFQKAAEKRLAKLGPEVAQLSEDELRARLRVAVVSTRTPSEGLATCARPISERFEARVVLHEIDLAGLPEPARARLDETDAELFERALDATLPAEPPPPEAGEASTQVWLCCPEAIFGSDPHVIVGAKEGLAWTPATSGDVEARLSGLAAQSTADGPMKAVMWAWDGRALSQSIVQVHTVMGPDTPDYTLSLPPSLHEPLGIRPASNGTFGVRRAR